MKNEKLQSKIQKAFLIFLYRFTFFILNFSLSYRE